MPPHFIKRRHLYISIDQTGSSATLMPKNIISEPTARHTWLLHDKVIFGGDFACDGNDGEVFEPGKAKRAYEYRDGRLTERAIPRPALLKDLPALTTWERHDPLADACFMPVEHPMFHEQLGALQSSRSPRPKRRFMSLLNLSSPQLRKFRRPYISRTLSRNMSLSSPKSQFSPSSPRQWLTSRTMPRMYSLNRAQLSPSRVQTITRT